MLGGRTLAPEPSPAGRRPPTESLFQLSLHPLEGDLHPSEGLLGPGVHQVEAEGVGALRPGLLGQLLEVHEARHPAPRLHHALREGPHQHGLGGQLEALNGGPVVAVVVRIVGEVADVDPEVRRVVAVEVGRHVEAAGVVGVGAEGGGDAALEAQGRQRGEPPFAGRADPELAVAHAQRALALVGDLQQDRGELLGECLRLPPPGVGARLHAHPRLADRRPGAGSRRTEQIGPGDQPRRGGTGQPQGRRHHGGEGSCTGVSSVGSGCDHRRSW